MRLWFWNGKICYLFKLQKIERFGRFESVFSFSLVSSIWMRCQSNSDKLARFFLSLLLFFLLSSCACAFPSRPIFSCFPCYRHVEDVRLAMMFRHDSHCLTACPRALTDITRNLLLPVTCSKMDATLHHPRTSTQSCLHSWGFGPKKPMSSRLINHLVLNLSDSTNNAKKRFIAAVNIIDNNRTCIKE